MWVVTTRGSSLLDNHQIRNSEGQNKHGITTSLIITPAMLMCRMKRHVLLWHQKHLIILTGLSVALCDYRPSTAQINSVKPSNHPTCLTVLVCHVEPVILPSGFALLFCESSEN